MNKALIPVLFGLTFAHAVAALAEPSLVYTNPPIPEYFRAPAGKGLLKICKMDDATDAKTMLIPIGTYFADQGSMDGYTPGRPQAWLLTVMTTQSTTLKKGQKCATVKARVGDSTPPPAHPELKSVLHFQKSDKRYFEITAPVDTGAPIPDLAPWNSSYPSLQATAASDFK